MNLKAYPPNIRLFIVFRILFHTRFYYPVFAVMFLDFGLTMEHLALLNVVWAMAIVLLEVPSGALADRVGRKRLVQAATALMVAEMMLIAFVPLGHPRLVFYAFLCNRILSGTAEALASGADEALAYDSLVETGQTAQWPKVLEALLRWQALAFIVAMLVGAALYDPVFVGRITAWLGINTPITRELTMRFPIYLTLAGALVCLLTTSKMTDPQRVAVPGETAKPGSTWTLMVSAARWIVRTPAVFMLILAGLLHDSILRMFITIMSQYYRLIAIPEAMFGVIGAGLAVLGFLLPGWARRLTEKRSPQANFWLLACLCLAGFLGAGLAIPLAGVLFVVLIRIGIGLLNFFIPHYLNRQVDSANRATVLSFKGLAFNLGYAAMGLLYAGLHRSLTLAAPDASPEQIFTSTLRWLPWIFLAGLVSLVAFAKWIRIRLGAEAMKI